jgi:signal peptidase I
MTTVKEAKGESLWETVKTILYALALAMCIRFVFVQPFRIPSGSMQPTLLVGDYMVVSKWSYGYSRFSIEPLNFGWPSGRIFGHEPQRGDVVVFRPVPQEDKDLVKRLIGMPGDTIQVTDGHLIINGTPVQRASEGTAHFKEQTGEYDDIPVWRETLPNGKSYITFDRDPDGRLDNTDIYTVPEGNYFFMGDDRDNSADSRTPEVSYVPFENLVGKVQFVFVSFDPSTQLFKPWTLITGIRGDRFVHHVN